MLERYRSQAATVLVVAAALLLGFLFLSGRVRDARQACVDRGGQVVIESDATSIGQFCVWPDGSQQPI